MPLPGGAADKLGNRYEGRWIIHCMIDVMDEKAESIRIESPGEDAFEFFLQRDNCREYHQVKRQNSQLGHWTLNSLEKKQITVLSDIWQYLQRQDVTCVFVSTQDADELAELANRAQDAQSFTEFEQKFIDGKGISGKFELLKQKWNNCSSKDAYEALLRIKVETVGKEFLIDAIEIRLAVLVESDPKTIRVELAELIINSIHQELTAHDIWHYLTEKRGYRRREWNKDPHVLAAVEDINNRYVTQLKGIAIANKIIPRDETQTILEKLKSKDSKRALLITGEAGIGKSVVMLQVVGKLIAEGIPILPFRVDNLNPVVHPDDVGKQLQLPASPATVLAGISNNRECVLVIDQLDAVSLTSGRHPNFFNCINEIIQQALAHPNIRLLIACRKFDLDNDHRLKKITGEKGIAETININRLTHKKVKEVVTQLNLNATRLNSKQLDLLSIPLHLWLLSEIAENSNFNILNFKTAKDLFDRFWEDKPRELKNRLNRDIKWTTVIDLICDRMSKKQTVSVPQIIVDEYQSDAEAMISEHILVKENNQLRFFHDSFFDYAFARRFAARGQDLLSFLRSSEQHLFRRTQVRQILIHERETDFDSYLEHLAELLTSDDIRFHIKQIVFAWLGTLENPNEEEWEFLESITNINDRTLRTFAWNTFRTSVGWFNLLDSLSLIEQWLNSSENEDVERAFYLLEYTTREKPNRVAELLHHCLEASPKWLNRIGNLITHSEVGKNRNLFNLFLSLVTKGFFDGKGQTHDGFWSEILLLSNQNPQWTCEAIGTYFKRSLELSNEMGISNPLHWQSDILGRDNRYEKILTNAAQKAPEQFVANSLFLLLTIIERQPLDVNQELNNDPFWLYQCYGSGYNILDRLIDCIQIALCNLAKRDGVKCLKIVRLLNNQKFVTTQYLLEKIYIANTDFFLTQAYQYICGELASSKGKFSGRTDLEIKQLVQNITARCSQQELKHLENLILNYYPSWEREISQKYRKNFGYSQFILLNAIDLSRQSNVVKQRINELTRKFGKLPEETSCFSSLRTIAIDTPSPIPKSAIEKMTDEQWIRAINKYGTMQPPLEKDGRSISISAFTIDLSNRVKQEPDRFAKLVWQLSKDTDRNYFDAILRGIAESEREIDIATAFYTVQRCHNLSNKPCGRSISWLFQKLADLPWSIRAFDILLCYALYDSDPETEIWRANNPGETPYYGGDILTAGINTVRGAAVNAIASLIFADKTRGAYFQYALESIVRDKSIAVKACAAEILTAMLNYDRDLAVRLFLTLCDTEEILLGTQTVERFLYYSTYTHFYTLKPILERAVYSNSPSVIEVGARQSCIAALGNKEAQYLVDYCLKGTVTHRKAVAQVLVGNFKFAHFRQYCEDRLIALFDDNDKNVRSQTARCFYELKDNELRNYTNLIKKFVDSLAFDSDVSDLIYALEKTTAKLPEITYLVCDRFIKLLPKPGQKSYFIDADQISQLLIRLYSQSKNSMGSDCLDLIDRLCEMNVYGLDKAVAEYER